MRRRSHLQRQRAGNAQGHHGSFDDRACGYGGRQFRELKRENYVPAEEKTVQELKKLGKPFVILLNSVKPYSEETARLAKELEETYGVSVLPVNCEQLKKEDIFHILECVLKEFPVTEMDFHIPKWLEILPASHWLKLG